MAGGERSDDAIRFLEAELAGGPVPAKALEKACAEAGLSWAAP